MTEIEGKARIFTSAFLLLSVTNIFVFMSFQMLLTGMPVYVSQLGANSVQVGLVSTLATLGSVLCRPITGALVDRYGRRGFLIAGFAVMCLAAASYAVFPLVGVILVFRFVHGLGWGLASTANSTMVADVLPRKRFGEGIGYFSMTSSLALALGPALSVSLVEAGHAKVSIAIACALTCIGILLACVLCAFFYKQPPLKKEGSVRQVFLLRNMFERTALFPSVAFGVLSMGFSCVTTFIALMGAERGIENLALYFIVYAIANIIARPLLGRLVDKHGFLLAGILACASVAISLLMLAVAQSLWLVCVAGFIIGFGNGTGMSTFNTMAVSLAPPKARGAATSTFLFFFNGGMAVGTLVGGLLVGPLGYGGMLEVMAAIAVAACIIFLAGGRDRIESYHLRQQQ